MRRIFGNFSFRFAIKGVRKTVRYNDTIEVNERVVKYPLPIVVDQSIPQMT